MSSPAPVPLGDESDAKNVASQLLGEPPLWLLLSIPAPCRQLSRSGVSYVLEGAQGGARLRFSEHNIEFRALSSGGEKKYGCT